MTNNTTRKSNTAALIKSDLQQARAKFATIQKKYIEGNASRSDVLTAKTKVELIEAQYKHAKGLLYEHTADKMKKDAAKGLV